MFAKNLFNSLMAIFRPSMVESKSEPVFISSKIDFDSLKKEQLHLDEKQLRLTERCFDILRRAKFSEMELEQVRKVICKYEQENIECYRSRFFENWIKRENKESYIDTQSTCALKMWDAILVTFLTGENGFLILGAEEHK